MKKIFKNLKKSKKNENDRKWNDLTVDFDRYCRSDRNVFEEKSCSWKFIFNVDSNLARHYDFDLLLGTFFLKRETTNLKHSTPYTGCRFRPDTTRFIR